jgi:acyl carrier protein
LGQIQLPPGLEPETEKYSAHPALLDICLQLLGMSLPADSALATTSKLYVPTSLAGLYIYQPIPVRLWSHARLAPDADWAADFFSGDVRLLDDSGQVVAEFIGFRLQQLGHALPEIHRSAPAAQSESSRSTSAGPAFLVKAEDVDPSNKNGLAREAFLTLSQEERQQLLEDKLRRHIARTMKIAPSKVDIYKPLEDQGFDSLMAIEVKYRVESELEVEIPVRNLIEKPTVAQLAEQLGILLLQ